MLAAAIARVVEDRRRRASAGERPVIANVGPYPAVDRFARGQHRYGGVVAVDALGGKDVVSDQLDQRRESGGAGADPIRQGRGVEIDALASIAGALPVQRLMLAELGVKDHRQQAGACPRPCDRMEGRRRLGDPLAASAGELLTNGLDHFPPPRHHLQRLGDILTELGELAATTRAGTRPSDDHTLARQMCRQRRTYRLLPGEADDRRGVGRHRDGFVLGRARLQLLELQLHLVEQALPAFGRLAEPFALHLGDQELQVRHHRLGARSTRFSLLSRGALSGERRLQRVNLVRYRIGCRHGPIVSCTCNPQRGLRARLSQTAAASAGGFGTPAANRVPPINAVKHIGQLS